MVIDPEERISINDLVRIPYIKQEAELILPEDIFEEEYAHLGLPKFNLNNQFLMIKKAEDLEIKKHESEMENRNKLLKKNA